MARYAATWVGSAFDVPRRPAHYRIDAHPASGVSPLIWLIFPVTLGLAITRQSLWIDEGFTVWFASHNSFRSFLEVLIGSRGAPGDPQFIFYLLHMWGWIKLFGSSELSLRSANIPFAVIFIYTMYWASRRLFWNRNLWALFCLSPFFWFYLNEARPYVALLAFSSVATVALVAFLVEPERYGGTAPWFCLLALFLAWGSHILAFFLFPTLLIFMLMMISADSQLGPVFFRHWLRPILWCSPAFAALGIFYAWVSSFGVNKTGAAPGLRNLAFALYEFAGFAGLGPPRNDIRRSPGLAVFLPYWPWLLLGVAALIVVVVVALRLGQSRMSRNMLLSASAGLAIALTISDLQHFQVLGRHLAVFLPLVLIPLMLSSKRLSLSSGSSRIIAAAVILLGTAWAISDLRLVLMTRYQKDSYREACSLALSRAQTDRAHILWVADPVTARYYGLTITPPAGILPEIKENAAVDWSIRGSGVDARGWSLEQAQAFLSVSNTPIILVMSKPETSDPNRAWSSLVDSSGFSPLGQFNAFSVFEWRPSRGSI